VDLVALAGFTPVIGEDITFLDFAGVSGNFSTVELTGWSCPVDATCSEVFGANSLSYDITAATSTGVPEPNDLVLFATALLGLGLYSVRRSVKSSTRAA